jgi:GDP-4-dehydro-6-deoxy-D-mannose reductase
VRALVTGGDGFVGTILAAHLREHGDEVHTPPVDITDLAALRTAVVDIEPTVVYHLAALANVGDSWNAGPETYRVNTLGTVNVAESLRALPTCPRLLFVSSADVYGPDAMRAANGQPVQETVPTNPVSPYGGSKRAAEVALAQAFAGWEMPVVIARSFNHVGAGQAETFVVSALAKQIALAEQSGSTDILVGNLDAERDFLDVHDVVRAYRILAQSGMLGATYNVASGTAVPISAVAEFLLSCSSQPLKLVVDPSRFRPVDVPRIVGDTTKLRADTGWAPTSNWQVGANASLNYWRERLKALEMDRGQ